MAITIPSTQDLVTRNISISESKLNQTVPATDKSFLKVLSVALAMIETELEKKLDNDTKQNLALTASNDGLNDIGSDQSIVRILAESAVLTGTLTADTGKVLPATISFVGISNGVRYFPDNSVAESGGLITVIVTADEVGISGNLEVGAELAISSQLAGIGTILTVTVVDNIGAEEESDESYRNRVLENQRTVKGGGNSADYRKWSSVVAGVQSTYPYAGLPYPTDPINAVPPDRVVYVEAITDIGSDGLAPGSMLDEVRLNINTNQDTGLDNEPLGIVDESLYVLSIRRTTLYFEVRGLDVPASDEASIKSSIESALETYSRDVKPYIDGLDFIGDKNDTITDLTISELVQGIISDVGGDAEGVTFGVTSGVPIPRYTLGQGELVKSGGVTYVA